MKTEHAEALLHTRIWRFALPSYNLRFTHYRAVSSYSNQTWNITMYINIKHILFHVSSRLKTAIQTNPISRICCLWSISNVTVSQSATYTHAQQIAGRGPNRISLLLTGLMLLQSVASNPQRSNCSVWSEKWYILNTNPHTLSFSQKHNPSVIACHCFHRTAFPGINTSTVSRTRLETLLQKN